LSSLVLCHLLHHWRLLSFPIILSTMAPIVHP